MLHFAFVAFVLIVLAALIGLLRALLREYRIQAITARNQREQMITLLRALVARGQQAAPITAELRSDAHHEIPPPPPSADTLALAAGTAMCGHDEGDDDGRTQMWEGPISAASPEGRPS